MDVLYDARPDHNTASDGRLEAHARAGAQRALHIRYDPGHNRHPRPREHPQATPEEDGEPELEVVDATLWVVCLFGAEGCLSFRCAVLLHFEPAHVKVPVRRRTVATVSPAELKKR